MNIGVEIGIAGAGRFDIVEIPRAVAALCDVTFGVGDGDFIDGGGGIVVERDETEIDIGAFRPRYQLGFIIVDGEIVQRNVAFVFGYFSQRHAPDLDARIQLLRNVLGGGGQKFLYKGVALRPHVTDGGDCNQNKSRQRSESYLQIFIHRLRLPSDFNQINRLFSVIILCRRALINI